MLRPFRFIFDLLLNRLFQKISAQIGQTPLFSRREVGQLSRPNAQPFKLAEERAQSSKAGVKARSDQRPWNYRQSRR
jgi:hypothetical protein